MAKEIGATKFDPNSEAFQMRAEWKKAEIGRKLWHVRWSWLLDERKKALDEAKAIRNAAATSLPHVAATKAEQKSLKPVPATSFRFVGWLSARPDCQLEIYTPWRLNIPPKAPDAWELPGYKPKEDIKK